MTVERDLKRGTMKLTQAGYIGAMVKRFQVAKWNVHTPSVEAVLVARVEDEEKAGVKMYMQIVGSILHTVCGDDDAV